MTIRSKFLVATVATLMAGAAVPAMAVTLRYANQGDLKSLDPYTLNETTTNAHLGHVYEGLTKRGKDLAIEPGLAERWEISEDGLTWRFFLRKNVKFHNGNPFNADDVIFSATRVRAPGLELPDPRSERRRIREGRRLHRRREAEVAEPDPELPVGHLVHHGQGMGGGEQRRRADAGLRHDPELRGPQRQRHRPVQDREPPAGREDRLQAQQGLVGQGRAQPRRDRLHADRLRRHPRRSAALRRGGRDRAGSAAGHPARQRQRRTPRCWRAPSCARSSSASTRPATSCCSRT